MCLLLRNSFQYGYSFIIQTSSSFSESGFMCLEVKYRSENVISARIGRLSRNRDEACDTQLFFDKSIQSTTLISKFSIILYWVYFIENMIYSDTVFNILYYYYLDLPSQIIISTIKYQKWVTFAFWYWYWLY